MDYVSGEGTRAGANRRRLGCTWSGRLDWGLNHMQVGDELFVPEELATFGKAYAYAKTTQYKTGHFFTVDRVEGGSIVRRTVTREVKAGGLKPLTRPGVPGQPCDWGVIHKPEGASRFRWPLAYMELGDVFRADPADVSIERLRAAGYNIVGKHFSVSMDGSWIKVQRVAEPHVAWECVKFGIVRERLAALYETDDPKLAFDGKVDRRVLLDVLLPAKEAKGRVTYSLRRVEALPERRSYIFEAMSSYRGEFQRYALELFDDGVAIEPVASDMTQQMWDQRRLEQNPFA